MCGVYTENTEGAVNNGSDQMEGMRIEGQY